MATASASARGSFGFMPNRNDSMSRDVPSAIGTPIASPRAASTQTSRNTIQMTLPRRGSERHADADFTRPARHGVGHRAVEADARDHQRQDRKRAAESGKDDLLIDGLIDVGGLCLDIRHRHARVGLVHDLPDGADVAQRIAVGAQRERHLPQLRGGTCAYGMYTTGGISPLSPPYRAVAATPTISRSRGRRRPQAAADLDVPPDRVLVAEVGPGEEVAHHGDGRRPLPIAFLDLPPPQHRNLHRREEPRPRLQDARGPAPARR